MFFKEKRTGLHVLKLVDFGYSETVPAGGEATHRTRLPCGGGRALFDVLLLLLLVVLPLHTRDHSQPLPPRPPSLPSSPLPIRSPFFSSFSTGSRGHYSPEVDVGAGCRKGGGWRGGRKEGRGGVQGNQAAVQRRRKRSVGREGESNGGRGRGRDCRGRLNINEPRRVPVHCEAFPRLPLARVTGLTGGRLQQLPVRLLVWPTNTGAWWYS